MADNPRIKLHLCYEGPDDESKEYVHPYAVQATSGVRPPSIQLPTIDDDGSNFLPPGASLWIRFLPEE